uniref:TGF-beta family profile domain-containing protein n=1 Tax=Denticeps clupeoides TaxID=299321 RepID=A0AAY4BGP4_9TELE
MKRPRNQKVQIPSCQGATEQSTVPPHFSPLVLVMAAHCSPRVMVKCRGHISLCTRVLCCNRFAFSFNKMFLFLCELQRFLSEVLPPTQLLPHPTGGTSTVSLDTLDTLPPLSLGVASSENFLLGLLNSSAPTLFSFPHERSGLRSHRGELSLRPPTAFSVEVETGGKGDQTEGEQGNSSESQYLALLLLKALQTVQGVWEALPAQRTARGGQEEPAKAKCHLHSLTVSLEKYLLEPSTATINNCQGVCSFPLPNSNNHAILLNSLEQSTVPPSRLPCCVPVQYADLLVIELHSDGPTISVKTNMVAKECGCR